MQRKIGKIHNQQFDVRANTADSSWLCLRMICSLFLKALKKAQALNWFMGSCASHLRSFRLPAGFIVLIFVEAFTQNGGEF